MSIDVLLVDEDRDVLEIVQTFLEQEDDLDVTSEGDPETALELALSGVRRRRQRLQDAASRRAGAVWGTAGPGPVAPLSPL
ncbi:hypothetical protein ACFQER_13395 [Halomicroarcula sp. GCM10025894]|uniref:hypothetical protein n=1 Tax=Halomicroarcula sp. GCM10025894 TaxID=3252673 RepID=UPI00360FCA10